jgi:hypothetical protein
MWVVTPNHTKDWIDQIRHPDKKQRDIPSAHESGGQRNMSLQRAPYSETLEALDMQIYSLGQDPAEDLGLLLIEDVAQDSPHPSRPTLT